MKFNKFKIRIRNVLWKWSITQAYNKCRDHFEKFYLFYVSIVLIFIVAVNYLFILNFYNDFIVNLITEFVGILFVIYILDNRMKYLEKKKWEPSAMIAYKQMFSIIEDHLSFFFEIAGYKIPKAARFVRFHENDFTSKPVVDNYKKFDYQEFYRVAEETTGGLEWSNKEGVSGKMRFFAQKSKSLLSELLPILDTFITLLDPIVVEKVWLVKNELEQGYRSIDDYQNDYAEIGREMPDNHFPFTEFITSTVYLIDLIKRIEDKALVNYLGKF